MKSHSRFLPATVLCLAFAMGAAAQDYKLVKKIALGGEGGWDYLTVDSAARRLYIARSTRVMVVDLKSEKLLGEIPDVAGAHGVALVPTLRRGFASAGRAGEVLMFDLQSLKTLQRIKVGEGPDAILYDAPSKRIFVMNGRSHDASVIDAASATVVGTIPLGGKPEFGVSDGKGKVFVNIEDTGEVAAIDTKAMKVLTRWKLGTCEEPSGLALDEKNRSLFSACANREMAVSSADKGAVIATLPIGRGTDGAAFDPSSNNAFSSNGEGTITVVHEDAPGKFHVAQTVTTQRGARTITLDPKTHHLLSVTAEFGPAPAPTAEAPRPRPAILPGTFAILVVGR